MTLAPQAGHDLLGGAALLARLDALGAISDRADGLQRLFMTDAHRQAAALIGCWMREAGLAVRTDAAGNVIGRLEAAAAGAPALVLGSHYDTVRDAGKYDGPLGIVTAIACAAALSRRSAGLPFALEVMAFAEEEGVRFGTTLLGSRAVAGSLDPAVLACADPAGQTIAAAMAGQGLDPARIGTAARRHEAVLAYVELHIEQGPVLEARGLPVGVVSSISGAVRYAVDVSGEAGHAGTVPMGSRHDALTAASACVLAVEACAAQHGAVATVGVLEVANGAVNVIPGHVRFTIDLRMPDDTHLRQCEADLLRQIGDIAVSRGVKLDTRKIQCQSSSALRTLACRPDCRQHPRGGMRSVRAAQRRRA